MRAMSADHFNLIGRAVSSQFLWLAQRMSVISSCIVTVPCALLCHSLPVQLYRLVHTWHKHKHEHKNCCMRNISFYSLIVSGLSVIHPASPPLSSPFPQSSFVHMTPKETRPWMVSFKLQRWGAMSDFHNQKQSSVTFSYHILSILITLPGFVVLIVWKDEDSLPYLQQRYV